MAPRHVCVVAAALTGAIATVVTAARFAGDHGRILDALASRPLSVASGAIAGALCGVLFAVLCAPRRRVTRAAGILVTLNAVAWSIFLVGNARISDGGASIVEQRARLDDKTRDTPHGMVFTDGPVFRVAGRMVNWVALSQKPLGLLAGPAVAFVHEQVVPERYWRTGPTVAESDWIAAAAFVISTAWWVSAGTIGARLRRLKARR